MIYVDAATDGFTKFPAITGGSTYVFTDPQDIIIDGPTIALPSGTILSRTSCEDPPGAAASWTAKPASAGSATPGTGPLSTGQDRICITEIADSNRQQFEYVEIFWRRASVRLPIAWVDHLDEQARSLPSGSPAWLDVLGKPRIRYPAWSRWGVEAMSSPCAS